MKPSETDGASNACVHFVSRDDAEAVKRHHRRDAFGLYDVDASALATKEALLSAIAAAMHFPDYFGMNWDALVDCLGDMSWDVRDGYVLFVRDADRLFSEEPAIAEAFVACWRAAAERWTAERVPFHLVVVR